MKKIALHWKILIGMLFGVLVGWLLADFKYENVQGDYEFMSNPIVDSQTINILVTSTNTKTDSVIHYQYTGGAKKGDRISLLTAEQAKNYKIKAIQNYDEVQENLTIKKIRSWSLVKDWIRPFGDIFINLLKLIAVPLILFSLIKGVSDLKDISQLSKMGGRTVGIYLFTTVLAVSIGLGVVNLTEPGTSISEKTRTELIEDYSGDVSAKKKTALEQSDKGPLQALTDMVPSNIFEAASDNGAMLKVIFFAIFFGVGLILIPQDLAMPVKQVFDGMNAVILKLIDLIMKFAPIGVFALLAGLVAESPNPDLFVALGKYAGTVVFGLAIMVIVYVVFAKFYAKKSILDFFNGIGPAQLLAFSTSSSAATLPVTMERTEKNLGVDKEVTSFVLPIGATINMDGTSLYQAVAAVFIAQTFGMDLSWADQMGIVATATLASIGSAAVPGAGMVMLVIVLGQAGIPEAGLALIFAVDRPLDMCRTVINVTGDATVSLLVGKSMKKLHKVEEPAEVVN